MYHDKAILTNRNKKSIILYNFLFPLWVAMFPPIFILIIGPINFLINSIILLLVLKYNKVEEILSVYKNNITKLWICGLKGNCIGGMLFIVTTLIKNEWFVEYIGSNKIYKSIIFFYPWDNLFVIVYILLAVMISGFYINKLIRNKLFLEMDICKKKRLVRVLTICMMPYSMLIPPEILTLNQIPTTHTRYFTNHIIRSVDESANIEVWSDEKYRYIEVSRHELRILAWSINLSHRLSSGKYQELDSIPADYVLKIFDDKETEKEVYCWILTESNVVFQYEDKWYELNEAQSQDFLRDINGFVREL